MSDEDKSGLLGWVMLAFVVAALVGLIFLVGCADKKTTRIVQALPEVEALAGTTTCTSWEDPSQTHEFRTRLIDGRGYRCAHRICLDKHGDCRYDCPREEACGR